MTGFVDPTKEDFARFKALPRGGPIWMLNLLRFRERAAYPPDHANADKGLSGAEAYRYYGRESAPVFQRVGGRQQWLAEPAMTLIGPPDEAWDLAFVAEYPDADAFIEMLRDPDYRVAVVHRQAAVADSRLIRMAPKPTDGLSFGD